MFHIKIVRLNEIIVFYVSVFLVRLGVSEKHEVGLSILQSSRNV